MPPSSAKPPALPLNATRFVATLFYKANTQHYFPHPDASPHSPTDALPSASLESLKDAGAVPTENMTDYPLEPPTPGPNPLDHLYGSYISQSCLNDFFGVLRDTIPGASVEEGEEGKVIRTLEGGKRPRVVEVQYSIHRSAHGNEEAQKDATLLEVLRRDEKVSRWEREWNVEAVFQADTIHRRYKRLAVFDMDSTLIQQEVIDEIAALIGVQKEVSAITAAAMNGELDFEQSLRARCKLLKGVPSSVWETLKGRLTFNEGVPELLRALKKLGFTTAVLSGGFQPLASHIAGILGLDYAFANNLVVSADGTELTGELVGEIVHAERKRQHVREIAAKEGILLEQAVCVGDGANDLPMMGVAGLGVAFHAKPLVQMQAPARLNSTSMLDVLYLFGITREEVDELLG